MCLRSGLASSAVAGIAPIGWRPAVSLDMVLADVQVEKRAIRIAESA
jgi:hypothetical protein